MVVPAAPVSCAVVALALPGHQATNDPFATVACTLLASDSTSVTLVTSAATCPCTSVYGWRPLVVNCDCEAWLIGPELVPPSPMIDTAGGGPPVPALNVCWVAPPGWALFAAVVVNDGPVRQVAVALPLCKIMAVNGPRVSVSTGCQPLVGIPDCDPPALASRDVHCPSAVVVSLLAGRVGVAVQPANAFVAPAPANARRTAAVAAPAAASAPTPLSGEPA